MVKVRLWSEERGEEIAREDSASFLWRSKGVVPTRGDVIDAATSERWSCVQTTFDVRGVAGSSLPP